MDLDHILPFKLDASYLLASRILERRRGPVSGFTERSSVRHLLLWAALLSLPFPG